MGNLLTLNLNHLRTLKHLIEHKKRLCVWVLGGPCSGRSTQCKLLAEYLQLVHISPDAIIRDCLNQEQIRKRESRLKRLSRKRMYTYNAIKTHEKMTQDEKEFLGSHHGKNLHSTISAIQPQQYTLCPDSDSEEDNLECPPLIRDLQNSFKIGQAVDPAVLTILIKEKMRTDSKNYYGFLIDGYPRTLLQAEKFVQRIGVPHVLLYLECPDEVLDDRIRSRARLAQRFDDNDFTIPFKFDTFHRHTMPMIEEWIAKLSAEPINGNMDVDVITQKCIHLIKKNAGSKLRLKLRDPKRDSKKASNSSKRSSTKRRSRAKSLIWSTNAMQSLKIGSIMFGIFPIS